MRVICAMSCRRIIDGRAIACAGLRLEQGAEWELQGWQAGGTETIHSPLLLGYLADGLAPDGEC